MNNKKSVHSQDVVNK